MKNSLAILSLVLCFVLLLLLHPVESFVLHTAASRSISKTRSNNKVDTHPWTTSQIRSLQQQQQQPHSFALNVANEDNTTSEKIAAAPSAELNTDALTKYGLALGIQMTLLTVVFATLDAIVNFFSGVEIPFAVTCFGFYALSLKSRIFNPLNNQRPDMKKAINQQQQETSLSSPGFGDRIMPSWTPPGFVFPIAWLLINGPLRAYSSALIYEQTGHLCNAAILAFMFHLSVGDVWNTINNTEKRLGTSVSVVVMVYATAAFAAHQYYQIQPLAGQLLGGVLVWLTIATALVVTTWTLNITDAQGRLDPLYPTTDIDTEFAWFQAKQE